MKIRCVIGLIFACVLNNVFSADTTMMKYNLPIQPPSKRFALSDRVWPTNYGQADVCLWKKDKMAAISFTIDDNVTEEHAWWIKQGIKYGWKFTWFVIAEFVKTYPDYYGPWSSFRNLFSLGHDIQSHTYDHNPNADTTADSIVDWSYKLGKKTIEDSVPGCKVTCLAYPSGVGKPKIAQRYYISARGVLGAANEPNQTWYMVTNCGGFSLQEINDLIKLNLNNPSYWRGWEIIMKHDVGGDSCNNGIRDSEQIAACLQPKYTAFDALMDSIKVRENNLWIGTYSEVAKYGEERDTHILTVKTVDPSYITFSISDSMVDSIFNYPLTVKIRISPTWVKPLIAIQGQDTLWDSLITNNGYPYVLVNAVPDRGDVKVFPTSISIKTNTVFKPSPLKINLLKRNKTLVIQLTCHEYIMDKIGLFSINGKLLKVLIKKSSEGQFEIETPANNAIGMCYLKIDLENRPSVFMPVIDLN